ncbi:MAG: hypothetical protein DCF15_10975 [Phormidesmis priestleyi]|uniref:Uncharacterized protein n=1 Tax=Phormidesmis priestleyi TaxID=268141 RepID=A0A2W4XDV9_9CYAN|nr:MAG: hypothetical protein DCF15_10975 [Phormidesmis priestleyi]
MTTQLSPAELQEVQILLKDYAPAQEALVTLDEQDNILEAALTELIAESSGAAAFGPEREKLRDVFLRNLRREVCGDDSFREKVESYSKSPDKAMVLTGLIVYVVNLVSLPVNPAIATIVVLWMLKLGLRTFCDYTEPA